MPLRRALSALIVILFASALAACGRQVTPDPTTNNLSNTMLVKFRTKAAMDFTNFNYVIVFNTCSLGGEPYPNVFTTTFTNYSYAFAIGANFAGSTVQPTLIQYILTPGTSNQLNPQTVQYNPTTTQFTPNDNGSNNEFTLIFPISQLSNPLNVPTPCPSGATQSSTWFINFFTLDKTSRVQDSLGINGANDTSFQFSINTTVSSNNALFRPSGIVLPSNQAAAIDGGEIDTH